MLLTEKKKKKSMFKARASNGTPHSTNADHIVLVA